MSRQSHLWRPGDAIDAELRFQEFLLQYPDYPGAHVNLAIIFADRGDLVAAENSLTDALIIDPEYAPALNQLGTGASGNGATSRRAKWRLR